MLAPTKLKTASIALVAIWAFQALAAAEVGARVPRVTEPVWVIAAKAEGGDRINLPEVAVDLSNNNLAIRIFRERLYFAFRSATHHHPKPPIWSPQYREPGVALAKTRLYVVSAPIDERLLDDFAGRMPHLTWRLEMELNESLGKHHFEGQVAKLASNQDSVRGQAWKWFESTFGETISAALRSAWKRAENKPGAVPRGSTDARAIPRPFLFEYDLREPCFVVLQGRLHLYAMQIEGTPMVFRPMRTWHWSLAAGESTWSAPSPVLAPEEHFWEVQAREEPGGMGGGEVAYMATTAGARYKVGREEVETRIGFYRSKDGERWDSVNPRGFVDRGGACEPAFCFEPQGNTLWSILRLEDGDDRGWGALVGRAHASPLAPSWDLPLRADPRRFDSPRLFAHQGEVYMIARQHITKRPDGSWKETENSPYDPSFEGQSWEVGASRRESVLRRIRNGELSLRGMNLSATLAGASREESLGVTLEYMRQYYLSPKRTALYRLNQSKREFEILLTLPSAGDTAFPSIQPLGSGRFLVANYSSDPAKADWSWADGQQNRTGIYFVLLDFR